MSYVCAFWGALMTSVLCQRWPNYRSPQLDHCQDTVPSLHTSSVSVWSGRSQQTFPVLSHKHRDGPGWCHICPIPQGAKRTTGMSCLVTSFTVCHKTLGLGMNFVSGLPSQEEQTSRVGYGWVNVFSVEPSRNSTYKTLFLILFSCASVANWDKVFIFIL